MTSTVGELIDLLDLEPLEVNLFRGRSPQALLQRVFGGQVLGQALVAATRTVDKRVAHSLHAYFIRPGDPKTPIIYEVDRARDGRSFTTRRVVAIQHGRPIFNMSVSFHLEEEGAAHQFDLPDVPAPEDLESEHDLRLKAAERLPPEKAKFIMQPSPIELRPVAPADLVTPDKRPPQQYVWMRATGELPESVALNQCVLAYASDMTLLDTCILPHGIGWLDDRLQSASLDHAIWFHRPFRADDWLLYAQDSPCSFGARGFNRGSIYTRQGDLVASVAQEGLIRIREQPRKR